MLLQAATITALASLAASAASWRTGRRLRAELAAAQRRLELLGVPVVDNARNRRAVGAAALRREERLKFDTDEEGYYRRLRKLLLADFRDVAGADEAVFWRWNDASDGLVADSWSSDGSAPTHFDFAEWGQLVQWSAETGVIQTVGHEDLVIVGAACVLQEDSVVGVLTLTRTGGLALPRPSLKAWMPRMAAQLGAFKELVDVRKSYGRHMRQSQALLDAVQRLQGFQKGEGLARALCETALEVSGGRGATLIRWFPEADRGEIHHATAGTGLPARDGSFRPIALGADSLVAEACRSGAPHVLDDARVQGSGEELYGVRRQLGNPGAVAILPLTKGDRVLGALAIEADAPAGVTLDETRPLAVLGAVVANSLELAWSFEEVDRQSRTDALTGLHNRMHFAEELQRRLSDAGPLLPLSLVLVDVDHFKRVNDSWGHEAGDAVLKHVAKILQEGVRSGDVCARYGGEEMAMLMTQTDSVRAAEAAERLRAGIESTVIRHGGAEIAVTASFGVATYPETVREKDQLFPSADQALYAAKHGGRNQVVQHRTTRGRATT